ncbi:MAG: LacI family DNA-binding transcriptional regulator [Terriglobales bacterium]
MPKRPTIIDIAKALGVSVSTVHRALKGDNNTTAMTRNRVLQMAKQLEYKPNLAARFLSSKRSLRISINTPKGNTSFWDEVRAGIEDEKESLNLENVQVVYRTFSHWGEDELAGFEQALDEQVHGIIAFPSDPAKLKPLMRRAARQNIPVTFVATDAPDTGRLAVVSMDTRASGSLAADIIARILRGRGKVAVTVCAANVIEHAEKYSAFRRTMADLYPGVMVLPPVEDHGNDAIGYKAVRKLLKDHPDLVGIYITTEESMPVIKAARDMKKLAQLTLVATDLFPALVDEIRSGVVTATIYQRPRTQGRMAFRVMHQYLLENECPPAQITFAPHLVMRGNLEFFLQRTSPDTEPGRIGSLAVPKVSKQNSRRATYSAQGVSR